MTADLTQLAGEERTENPPAFPNTGNSTWSLAPASGMTLRDWFAGQALAAVIEAMQRSHIGDHETAGGGPSGFAATAYDIADALLRARSPSREEVGHG